MGGNQAMGDNAFSSASGAAAAPPPPPPPAPAATSTQNAASMSGEAETTNDTASPSQDPEVGGGVASSQGAGTPVHQQDPHPSAGSVTSEFEIQMPPELQG